jgi:hypothetical protein
VLVADPAKRPSVAQLLQHPWVAVGLPPGMLQCNDKVWRWSGWHLPCSRCTLANWPASCRLGSCHRIGLFCSTACNLCSEPMVVCLHPAMLHRFRVRLPYMSNCSLLQVLRMHPPASMQSEEDMQRIAREARVPVMTGQGEDIDGMADDIMDQDEMVRHSAPWRSTDILNIAR